MNNCVLCQNGLATETGACIICNSTMSRKSGFQDFSMFVQRCFKDDPDDQPLYDEKQELFAEIKIKELS